MPTKNIKKPKTIIQMWTPPEFKREIDVLAALSGKSRPTILKELAKKVKEHNKRLSPNQGGYIDFNW